MGKVLHASYSGYFPFCLDEYDLDEQLPAYSPISLDLSMKIWWRIKKFRFYGNYIANIDGEPVEQPWEFTAIRNAGSEERIVCYKFPAWNIESQINTVQLEVSMQTAWRVEVVEEGRTEIKYILSFGFSFFVENPSVQEQGVSYGSPSESDNVNTYDFEGLTLYDTQFVGSATILGHEILEYWSYGGTYNTSTGLPL